MFDLALLNQVLHCPCNVFGRNVGIDAVLIQEINHIGLEPLEGSEATSTAHHTPKSLEVAAYAMDKYYEERFNIFDYDRFYEEDKAITNADNGIIRSKTTASAKKQLGIVANKAKKPYNSTMGVHRVLVSLLDFKD